MRFFFADDSRQKDPSRPRMGSLVAIGGISVPAAMVKSLESRIDDFCSAAGFPPREEFKWSPGPELWMHDHLHHPARGQFFRNVLAAAGGAGVSALVVIEDASRKPANPGLLPEDDTTAMFLERADTEMGRDNETGVVIVDRPRGDSKSQDRFLARCLETLQSGTEYSTPTHIIMNVVSTPSKLVRLLQLADLIVGCTCAYVAGENQFSPETFSHIRPLLCSQWGCIGGIGVKVHPDFLYANLYHWLFGDSRIWKREQWVTLPAPGAWYARDAWQPRSSDSSPWPPER